MVREGRNDEPVLAVVGEGGGPVEGHVALGVVAERGAVDGGDPVEPVGRRARAAAAVPGPGVEVVVDDARRDLRGRVVGQGRGPVAGAGQIVGQPDQPRGAVIIVARGRALTGLNCLPLKALPRSRSLPGATAASGIPRIWLLLGFPVRSCIN